MVAPAAAARLLVAGRRSRIRLASLSPIRYSEEKKRPSPRIRPEFCHARRNVFRVAPAAPASVALKRNKTPYNGSALWGRARRNPRRRRPSPSIAGPAPPPSPTSGRCLRPPADASAAVLPTSADSARPPPKQLARRRHPALDARRSWAAHRPGGEGHALVMRALAHLISSWSVGLRFPDHSHGGGRFAHLSSQHSRQPTNRRPVVAGPTTMRSPQFVVEHRFTRRHLSAYLDAELEPSERRRVERHVAECRDRRFATRSLRRMLAGLARLRRCAASRLSADVRARLDSRSLSGARRERGRSADRRPG